LSCLSTQPLERALGNSFGTPTPSWHAAWAPPLLHENDVFLFAGERMDGERVGDPCHDKPSQFARLQSPSIR